MNAIRFSYTRILFYLEKVPIIYFAAIKCDCYIDGHDGHVCFPRNAKADILKKYLMEKPIMVKRRLKAMKGF